MEGGFVHSLAYNFLQQIPWKANHLWVVPVLLGGLSPLVCKLQAGLGFLKVKQKRGQKKLLGAGAFWNAGSSTCGVQIFRSVLRVCVLILPFSLELGVGLGRWSLRLGLSQNHLDPSLGENMDSRPPPPPHTYPICTANCWYENPTLQMGWFLSQWRVF